METVDERSQQERPQQEKEEMTSLDMRFLVKELRNILVGGVVRKIYQYGKAGSRQFLFEVWVPQDRAHWKSPSELNLLRKISW